MYKIMVLVRETETGENSLWKYLWEANAEGVSAEYSSDSLTEIQDKVASMLNDYNVDQIRVVSDMSLDIVVTVS